MIGVDRLALKDSFWGVSGYGSPARERVEGAEAVGTSWWPLPRQYSQADSLMSRDEEDAGRPEKAQVSPPTGKMSNPFLQLAQNPMAPTYKQGILARKMHHDADGKKSECLLPHCVWGLCPPPNQVCVCTRARTVALHGLMWGPGCRQMAQVKDRQPVFRP